MNDVDLNSVSATALPDFQQVLGPDSVFSSLNTGLKRVYFSVKNFSAVSTIPSMWEIVVKC